MQTQINTPWGVTTFGSGSVKALPDLAHVRIAVDRVERTAEEAFASTRGHVNQVREALRTHGVDDRAVEVSRLGLEDAYDYNYNDRKFLGYRCVASFSLQVTDLDSLEAILVAATGAGANKVHGVTFDVAAKPELRARARQEAVATARRKAELYAASAQVRLGPVIHIEDVDPETLGHAYRGHGGGSGVASAADLAPGHVTVSAAVVLGFAIIPN